MSREASRKTVRNYPTTDNFHYVGNVVRILSQDEDKFCDKENSIMFMVNEQAGTVES